MALEGILDRILIWAKTKIMNGLFFMLNWAWEFFLEYFPFFVLFAIIYIGFIRPFRSKGRYF